MAQRQLSAYRATLLGDVVGSKGSADRAALHHDLTAALREVTDEVEAITAPDVTAGDELQGSYATVGAALHAAFYLRLRLRPQIDVRFGIGWGEVIVLDTDRGIVDGSGWWSARAAIEATERAEAAPGLRRVRTTYGPHDDTGPAPEAVNAALTCRDHLFGSLDDRSLRILRGLMAGQTKSALAEAEGISASAVSQRTHRDGLEVIVRATDWLRQVR